MRTKTIALKSVMLACIFHGVCVGVSARARVHVL